MRRLLVPSARRTDGAGHAAEVDVPPTHQGNSSSIHGGSVSWADWRSPLLSRMRTNWSRMVGRGDGGHALALAGRCPSPGAGRWPPLPWPGGAACSPAGAGGRASIADGARLVRLGGVGMGGGGAGGVGCGAAGGCLLGSARAGVSRAGRGGRALVLRGHPPPSPHPRAAVPARLGRSGAVGWGHCGGSPLDERATRAAWPGHGRTRRAPGGAPPHPSPTGRRRGSAPKSAGRAGGVTRRARGPASGFLPSAPSPF